MRRICRGKNIFVKKLRQVLGAVTRLTVDRGRSSCSRALVGKSSQDKLTAAESAYFKWCLSAEALGDDSAAQECRSKQRADEAREKRRRARAEAWTRGLSRLGKFLADKGRAPRQHVLDVEECRNAKFLKISGSGHRLRICP